MPNDLPILSRMRQFTSFVGVVMVPSQTVVVLVLCEHKPRLSVNVLHNTDEKLEHRPDVFFPSLYTSTHLFSDDQLHENSLQAALLPRAVQLNSPTQVDVTFSLVEHPATVGHIVIFFILLHSVALKVHAELDSHFPLPQVLSAAMYPSHVWLQYQALPLLSPSSQTSFSSGAQLPHTAGAIQVTSLIYFFIVPS